MPSFSNLKEFMKYVRNQTLNVFRIKLAESIKKTLEKFVQEEVYSRPQGEYQRTMDLLNGIEIFDFQQTKTNTYEISIGWSWDNYMSHTTILGGSSFNYKPGENIPVALVSYALENDYTWNRSGTNFIGLTYEELKNTNKCIKILKQELKNNGMIVK